MTRSVWRSAAAALGLGIVLSLMVLPWRPVPTVLAQDLEMLDRTAPLSEPSAPGHHAPEHPASDPPAPEITGGDLPPALADDDGREEQPPAEAEPAESASGYETWGDRKASALLPADLLSGPHHRVDETVGSFGYQHRYRVESDFGEFRASGDSMLRRLLREIAAIATLRATLPGSPTPPEGAAAPASLWEDPVATVTALPDGPFAIIDRGNGRLATDAQNGAAIPVLEVQQAKRDLAYRLAVDVYSSNAVLQRALNRAAWTSVVSGVGPSLESHRPPGSGLEHQGDRLATQILRDIGPEELRVENRRTLALMGFPEPLIDRFLDHKIYSPRHRTIIVQALEALPDVAGRRRLVEAALAVTSETGALFYQQVAETLAAIQADAKALPGNLVELAEFGGLILAYGDGGTAVLPLPLDCARWTASFARLMRHLAAAHPRAGDGTRLQVWVTGTLSLRARDELTALGLEAVETVAAKVALAD